MAFWLRSREPRGRWNNGGMTSRRHGLESAREAVSRYAWREAFDLFAAADAVEPLGAGRPRPDGRVCLVDRQDAALHRAAGAGPRRVPEGRRRTTSGRGRHRARRPSRPTSARSPTRRPGSRRRRGCSRTSPRRRARLAEAGDGTHPARSRAISAGRWLGRGGRGRSERDTATRTCSRSGHAFSGYLLGLHRGPRTRARRWSRRPRSGAVAGELGPRATGWIYCMMIAVNAQLADWQRAGQWTEAATRWCNRQAINGFPGVAGSTGPRSCACAVPSPRPRRRPVPPPPSWRRST